MLFTRAYSKNLSSLIDVSPEIRHALKTNKSVVALESTIITHGMPYPQNIETALEVENEVRKEVVLPDYSYILFIFYHSEYVQL